MYKFLTWVKINLHWLILTFIGLCLIGVGINSCVETKNEKQYELTYKVFEEDTTTENKVETNGYPYIDFRNKEYRIYDNRGEILHSKDSVSFANIIQK